ncbi:phospholipid/cholesterol/gamma-HCH transport system ATP-binding protein [Chitinophaga sp. CF118]|uniref:ABC transporter ATP-binding protein n=1 Tax=Chitinophaga sp. CF118 TaxID=1884367 RepID=UPI0008DF223E|nr:ATP-binding cassette domain-containing protein [Chitinophaga sp. CF118]SFD59055.1 phospholipid/cholesterol/gamma-HCH transport system ATP-binding protein [Chitinophaga sp. CF118]
MDINDVIISIKNLKKSFGTLSVLNGIDIEIEKGENIAVLGRSGSGKSVLIKIISGLLKPDSGTVKVLGREVDKISDAELQKLRLKIGFSFQSSALYDSMSVKQNLEFPLVRNLRNLSRKEVNAAIEEVLSDVGLSQTINQMPSELSGGQKKRIGIARTLILKPEIMLYDEPTSGLDPITSIEINKLIVQVREQYNTTAIIITHDLVCAKETADRVAMLLDGKFLMQGSFEEVFNTDNENVRTFYDYNFINAK